MRHRRSGRVLLGLGEKALAKEVTEGRDSSSAPSAGDGLTGVAGDGRGLLKWHDSRERPGSLSNWQLCARNLSAGTCAPLQRERVWNAGKLGDRPGLLDPRASVVEEPALDEGRTEE